MEEHRLISAQEEAGEGSLKAGDVVELTATATYYDGRIIPAWVKKEQWIVKRIDGDRQGLGGYIKRIFGCRLLSEGVRGSFFAWKSLQK